MTLLTLRDLHQRIGEKVACHIHTDATGDHSGSHLGLTVHYHRGCNDALIKRLIAEAGMKEVTGFKGEGKHGQYYVRRYIAPRG